MCDSHSTAGVVIGLDPADPLSPYTSRRAGV